MKVDSFNMYRFTFAYEGTELMIPMAAATQEEAVQKLRTFMQGWVNELTPATPTLSPVQMSPKEMAPPDPFVLQMRIEEMVKELIPFKKPKGAQTVERLVKEWTGFPYTAENYPAIIADLARLKVNE